jgi:hypothetical protein
MVGAGGVVGESLIISAAGDQPSRGVTAGGEGAELIVLPGAVVRRSIRLGSARFARFQGVGRRCRVLDVGCRV